MVKARVIATIDVVMEEERIDKFEKNAETSDWAAITLIDLGGDGERISGGFNGLEIEKTDG
jgi:hypothetical protein